MKIDEQKVLERIGKNDKRALDQLYLAYRTPFLTYFKKYDIPEDEIKDIYQDTMIAFYQKGVQGKLNKISSSLKTYVFGIGKHKVIDAIRKKGKKVPFSKEEEYESISFDEKEYSEEQLKLYSFFKLLGESCQKMLQMFYYRGLDLKEIAQLAGYKDENSVKSHKSRCLKQLKDMIKEKNG